MPPQIEEHLFRLRVRGVLPVMAHPERYVAVQQNLSRAESLGRGAALVVDLGALAGAHGDEACRASRALVERGLAHAAASDIHHRKDLAEVSAGIAWLKKKTGQAGVNACSGRSAGILAGQIPRRKNSR